MRKRGTLAASFKNSRESLSSQTKRAILDGIMADGFAREGKIPSEIELCEMYGVSRATVRSALRSLEDDGVITTKHGVGSFVNYVATSSMRMRIDMAKGFFDLISSSGHIPSIASSSFHEEIIPDEMRRNLMLPDNSKALVLKRLFLADGMPALVSFDYMPLCNMREVPQSPEIKDSILELSRAYLTSVAYYSNTEISTSEPTENLNGVLDARKTLLKLRELHYNKNNEPIAFTVTYINDDIIRFQVRRRFLA